MDYIKIIDYLIIVCIAVILVKLFYKKINESYKNTDNLQINQTFVINMNKDQKRLKFIQQQCKNANIPFTRFPAINGNKLNLQKLQENNTLKFNEYSFFNHDKQGRNSLKSSIGCALTHKNLWKKALSNDVTLILEDDSIIPKNFWQQFNKYKQQIPDDWDIIFLGGSRIYGKQISNNIVKALSTDNNFWNNCGLYAYIINKKSAKQLLKLTNPITNYIDIQINRYYNNLNVYYLNPVIITHNFEIKSSRNSPQKNSYRYPKYFIEKSKKITIV